MRIFNSDRMDSMLTKLSLQGRRGRRQHPWINKALERAQKKVEARNYRHPRSLLKYDDVLNDGTKVVFEQRLELMEATNISETVSTCVVKSSRSSFQAHSRTRLCRTVGCAGPEGQTNALLNLDLPIEDWGQGRRHRRRRYPRTPDGRGQRRLHGKVERRFGDDIMPLCRAFDRHADAGLSAVARTYRQSRPPALRRRFRGYAQRDPLQEYKSEAFELFTSLLNSLRRSRHRPD